MTRVKDTMLFWPNVTLEGDAIDECHVHSRLLRACGPCSFATQCCLNSDSRSSCATPMWTTGNPGTTGTARLTPGRSVLSRRLPLVARTYVEHHR
jgi:hypothetical protein